MPTCSENCVDKSHTDTDKAIDEYASGAITFEQLRARIDDIRAALKACVEACKSAEFAACFATLKADDTAKLDEYENHNINDAEAKQALRANAAAYLACTGGPGS